MVVSPEPGRTYVVTQGDEWDVQKDAFQPLSELSLRC